MSLDLKGSAQLSRPIHGVDELVADLRSAEKPASQWRIGVEHEKLGFAGGSPPLPVPYEGPRGIRALLETMARDSDGAQKLHEEAGNPIALLAADGSSVTLEPGGQLELSGAPARGLAQVEVELKAHLAAVREASSPLGLRWLAAGYRPFGAREDMPWMPKLRYGAMRRSLGPRARLSLDMMLMTATVQANLDWSSEEDLASKVRTATLVSPLVSALFANSPLVQGKDSGFLDFRYQVWRETDPARCGLLEQMVRPDWGYRAYVDWALDVPLLFVRRDGEYLDCDGRTFRQWLSTGSLRGERLQPTFSSWADHLTTLFPEVRVKRVLELRGADSVPQPYLLALPAIWMGLLYDPQARAAAAELTAKWSFAELVAFQGEVAVRALGAKAPRGASTLSLARELVAIARAGLARWGEASGHDDVRFLDPVAELAKEGRTLAERALQAFASSNRDPSSLIEGWAIG